MFSCSEYVNPFIIVIIKTWKSGNHVIRRFHLSFKHLRGHFLALYYLNDYLILFRERLHQTFVSKRTIIVLTFAVNTLTDLLSLCFSRYDGYLESSRHWKVGKRENFHQGGVTLNPTVRLGKRIRARSANAFLLIAMQAG